MPVISKKIKIAFLVLVIVQAFHSIEEYIFKLYDVFLPAKIISTLFNSNLSVGFLIFNIALVLFGIWCYSGPVRNSRPSAYWFLGIWIFIESINGIGHPVIAIIRGHYFPGLYTAPILLIVSIYLIVHLMSSNSRLE